jgi:hypothetical protein
MKTQLYASNGKAIVSLLLLINIILIGVIVWLNQRNAIPNVTSLIPRTGQTDFILAVNRNNEPAVYSADGTPWEYCKENECKQAPKDFVCGDNKLLGFCLFYFTANDADQTKTYKAAISDLLISPAFAGQADGICPIISYLTIDGLRHAQYPPKFKDPDCPPKL